MAQSRVGREPAGQRGEQAERAVARPVQLQERRQVPGRKVLESGRGGQRAQPVPVHQGVDAPPAAEAADGAAGRTIPGGAQHVVADQQQAARPGHPGALGEEAGRVGAVDERLDRIDQVGRRQVQAGVGVIALHAADPLLESGGADALGGQARLHRAQRDAGAADRKPPGQMAEAAADAAAEVDHRRRRGVPRVSRARRRRPGAQQVAQPLRDAVLHVVERRRAGADARSPHRAVDGPGATALAVAQEGRGMPVVVPPHLGAVEAGRHRRSEPAARRA